MTEEIEQPRSENGTYGLVWFGIAVAGVAVTAFSVFLCYYSYRGGFAQTSWPVVTAGLGLIIAFCILTVALIAGIRRLVFRRWYLFLAFLTVIMSGAAIIGLTGLIIIGIML